MKLQHINFCGSVDAVGYFNNQSELTQTARNEVPFFILHISKPNLHIFLEKEYADNSDDCLHFCI